jgi:hypothetical protein
MNIYAVRQHFAKHRSHLAVCAFAATLVVVGAIIGLPVLGIVGALFCATMMIGMVWMMVAMGVKHRR